MSTAHCSIAFLTLSDTRAQKQRDVNNPNLGFICLPVLSRPPATSHYLSFSQIPLIAIHPSNYDVGEYLCVQLTFNCLRY